MSNDIGAKTRLGNNSNLLQNGAEPAMVVGWIQAPFKYNKDQRATIELGSSPELEPDMMNNSNQNAVDPNKPPTRSVPGTHARVDSSRISEGPRTDMAKQVASNQERFVHRRAKSSLGSYRISGIDLQNAVGSGDRIRARDIIDAVGTQVIKEVNFDVNQRPQRRAFENVRSTPMEIPWTDPVKMRRKLAAENGLNLSEDHQKSKIAPRTRSEPPRLRNESILLGAGESIGIKRNEAVNLTPKVEKPRPHEKQPGAFETKHKSRSQQSNLPANPTKRPESKLVNDKAASQTTRKQQKNSMEGQRADNESKHKSKSQQSNAPGNSTNFPERKQATEQMSSIAKNQLNKSIREKYASAKQNVDSSVKEPSSKHLTENNMNIELSKKNLKQDRVPRMTKTAETPAKPRGQSWKESVPEDPRNWKTELFSEKKTPSRQASKNVAQMKKYQIDTPTPSMLPVPPINETKTKKHQDRSSKTNKKQTPSSAENNARDRLPATTKISTTLPAAKDCPPNIIKTPISPPVVNIVKGRPPTTAATKLPSPVNISKDHPSTTIKTQSPPPVNSTKDLPPTTIKTRSPPPVNSTKDRPPTTIKTQSPPPVNSTKDRPPTTIKTQSPPPVNSTKDRPPTTIKTQSPPPVNSIKDRPPTTIKTQSPPPVNCTKNRPPTTIKTQSPPPVNSTKDHPPTTIKTQSPPPVNITKDRPATTIETKLPPPVNSTKDRPPTTIKTQSPPPVNITKDRPATTIETQLPPPVNSTKDRPPTTIKTQSPPPVNITKDRLATTIETQLPPTVNITKGRPSKTIKTQSPPPVNMTKDRSSTTIKTQSPPVAIVNENGPTILREKLSLHKTVSPRRHQERRQMTMNTLTESTATSKDNHPTASKKSTTPSWLVDTKDRPPIFLKETGSTRKHQDDPLIKRQTSPAKTSHSKDLSPAVSNRPTSPLAEQSTSKRQVQSPVAFKRSPSPTAPVPSKGHFTSSPEKSSGGSSPPTKKRPSFLHSSFRAAKESSKPILNYKYSPPKSPTSSKKVNKKPVSPSAGLAKSGPRETASKKKPTTLSAISPAKLSPTADSKIESCHPKIGPGNKAAETILNVSTGILAYEKAVELTKNATPDAAKSVPTTLNRRHNKCRWNPPSWMEDELSVPHASTPKKSTKLCIDEKSGDTKQTFNKESPNIGYSRPRPYSGVVHSKTKAAKQEGAQKKINFRPQTCETELKAEKGNEDYASGGKNEDNWKMCCPADHEASQDKKTIYTPCRERPSALDDEGSCVDQDKKTIYTPCRKRPSALDDEGSSVDPEVNEDSCEMPEDPCARPAEKRALPPYCTQSTRRSVSQQPSCRGKIKCCFPPRRTTMEKKAGFFGSLFSAFGHQLESIASNRHHFPGISGLYVPDLGMDELFTYPGDQARDEQRAPGPSGSQRGAREGQQKGRAKGGQRDAVETDDQLSELELQNVDSKPPTDVEKENEECAEDPEADGDQKAICERDSFQEPQLSPYGDGGGGGEKCYRVRAKVCSKDQLLRVDVDQCEARLRGKESDTFNNQKTSSNSSLRKPSKLTITKKSRGSHKHCFQMKIPCGDGKDITQEKKKRSKNCRQSDGDNSWMSNPNAPKMASREYTVARCEPCSFSRDDDDDDDSDVSTLSVCDTIEDGSVFTEDEDECSGSRIIEITSSQTSMGETSCHQIRINSRRKDRKAGSKMRGSSRMGREKCSPCRPVCSFKEEDLPTQCSKRRKERRASSTNDADSCREPDSDCENKRRRCKARSQRPTTGHDGEDACARQRSRSIGHRCGYDANVCSDKSFDRKRQSPSTRASDFDRICVKVKYCTDDESCGQTEEDDCLNSSDSDDDTTESKVCKRKKRSSKCGKPRQRIKCEQESRDSSKEQDSSIERVSRRKIERTVSYEMLEEDSSGGVRRCEREESYEEEDTETEVKPHSHHSECSAEDEINEVVEQREVQRCDDRSKKRTKAPTIRNAECCKSTMKSTLASKQENRIPCTPSCAQNIRQPTNKCIEQQQRPTPRVRSSLNRCNEPNVEQCEENSAHQSSLPIMRQPTESCMQEKSRIKFAAASDTRQPTAPNEWQTFKQPCHKSPDSTHQEHHCFSEVTRTRHHQSPDSDHHTECKTTKRSSQNERTSKASYSGCHGEQDGLTEAAKCSTDKPSSKCKNVIKLRCIDTKTKSQPSPKSKRTCLAIQNGCFKMTTSPKEIRIVQCDNDCNDEDSDNPSEASSCSPENCSSPVSRRFRSETKPLEQEHRYPASCSRLCPPQSCLSKPSMRACLMRRPSQPRSCYYRKPNSPDYKNDEEQGLQIYRKDKQRRLNSPGRASNNSGNADFTRHNNEFRSKNNSKSESVKACMRFTPEAGFVETASGSKKNSATKIIHSISQARKGQFPSQDGRGEVDYRNKEEIFEQGYFVPYMEEENNHFKHKRLSPSRRRRSSNTPKRRYFVEDGMFVPEFDNETNNNGQKLTASFRIFHSRHWDANHSASYHTSDVTDTKGLCFEISTTPFYTELVDNLKFLDLDGTISCKSRSGKTFFPMHLFETEPRILCAKQTSVLSPRISPTEELISNSPILTPSFATEHDSWSYSDLDKLEEENSLLNVAKTLSPLALNDQAIERIKENSIKALIYAEVLTSSHIFKSSAEAIKCRSYPKELLTSKYLTQLQNKLVREHIRAKYKDEVSCGKGSICTEQFQRHAFCNDDIPAFAKKLVERKKTENGHESKSEYRQSHDEKTSKVPYDVANGVRQNINTHVSDGSKLHNCHSNDFSLKCSTSANASNRVKTKTRVISSRAKLTESKDANTQTDPAAVKYCDKYTTTHDQSSQVEAMEKIPGHYLIAQLKDLMSNSIPSHTGNHNMAVFAVADNNFTDERQKQQQIRNSKSRTHNDILRGSIQMTEQGNEFLSLLPAYCQRQETKEASVTCQPFKTENKETQTENKYTQSSFVKKKYNKSYPLLKQPKHFRHTRFPCTEEKLHKSCPLLKQAKQAEEKYSTNRCSTILPISQFIENTVIYNAKEPTITPDYKTATERPGRVSEQDLTEAGKSYESLANLTGKDSAILKDSGFKSLLPRDPGFNNECKASSTTSQHSIRESTIGKINLKLNAPRSPPKLTKVSPSEKKDMEQPSNSDDSKNGDAVLQRDSIASHSHNDNSPANFVPCSATDRAEAEQREVPSHSSLQRKSSKKKRKTLEPDKYAQYSSCRKGKDGNEFLDRKDLARQIQRGVRDNSGERNTQEAVIEKLYSCSSSFFEHSKCSCGTEYPKETSVQSFVQKSFRTIINNAMRLITQNGKAVSKRTIKSQPRRFKYITRSKQLNARNIDCEFSPKRFSDYGIIRNTSESSASHVQTTHRRERAHSETPKSAVLDWIDRIFTAKSIETPAKQTSSVLQRCASEERSSINLKVHRQRRAYSSGEIYKETADEAFEDIMLFSPLNRNSSQSDPDDLNEKPRRCRSRTCRSNNVKRNNSKRKMTKPRPSTGRSRQRSPSICQVKGSTLKSSKRHRRPRSTSKGKRTLKKERDATSPSNDRGYGAKEKPSPQPIAPSFQKCGLSRLANKLQETPSFDYKNFPTYLLPRTKPQILTRSSETGDETDDSLAQCDTLTTDFSLTTIPEAPCREKFSHKNKSSKPSSFAPKDGRKRLDPKKLAKSNDYYLSSMSKANKKKQQMIDFFRKNNKAWEVTKNDAVATRSWPEMKEWQPKTFYFMPITLNETGVGLRKNTEDKLSDRSNSKSEEPTLQFPAAKKLSCSRSVKNKKSCRQLKDIHTSGKPFKSEFLNNSAAILRPIKLSSSKEEELIGKYNIIEDERSNHITKPLSFRHSKMQKECLSKPHPSSSGQYFRKSLFREKNVDSCKRVTSPVSVHENAERLSRSQERLSKRQSILLSKYTRDVSTDRCSSSIDRNACCKRPRVSAKMHLVNLLYDLEIPCNSLNIRGALPVNTFRPRFRDWNQSANNGQYDETSSEASDEEQDILEIDIEDSEEHDGMLQSCVTGAKLVHGCTNKPGRARSRKQYFQNDCRHQQACHLENPRAAFQTHFGIMGQQCHQAHCMCNQYQADYHQAPQAHQLYCPVNMWSGFANENVNGSGNLISTDKYVGNAAEGMMAAPPDARRVVGPQFLAHNPIQAWHDGSEAGGGGVHPQKAHFFISDGCNHEAMGENVESQHDMGLYAEDNASKSYPCQRTKAAHTVEAGAGVGTQSSFGYAGKEGYSEIKTPADNILLQLQRHNALINGTYCGQGDISSRNCFTNWYRDNADMQHNGGCYHTTSMQPTTMDGACKCCWHCQQGIDSCHQHMGVHFHEESEDDCIENEELDEDEEDADEDIDEADFEDAKDKVNDDDDYDDLDEEEDDDEDDDDDDDADEHNRGKEIAGKKKINNPCDQGSYLNVKNVVKDEGPKVLQEGLMPRQPMHSGKMDVCCKTHVKQYMNTQPVLHEGVGETECAVITSKAGEVGVVHGGGEGRGRSEHVNHSKHRERGARNRRTSRDKSDNRRISAYNKRGNFRDAANTQYAFGGTRKREMPTKNDSKTKQKGGDNYKTNHGTAGDYFSLDQIKVPAIEKERVRFACDENGDWAEIGRGSYGCVYLGLLDGSIEVAIKDFYEASSWDLVIHEARMLTYLQDTGITPRFYGLRRRFDVSKQPSEYCIIMEYFGDGRTLFNVMSDKMVLRIDEWLDITGQLVAGLRIIHQKRVLINDLKADNILVDLTGGRKLIRYIDVGMATFKHGLTFQLPDDQVNKYNFLAPEVRSGGRTSTMSDIYSLGYLMEQMCRMAEPALGGLKKLVNQCMDKKAQRRPDVDEIVAHVHKYITAKSASLGNGTCWCLPGCGENAGGVSKGKMINTTRDHFVINNSV